MCNHCFIHNLNPSVLKWPDLTLLTNLLDDLSWWKLGLYVIPVHQSSSYPGLQADPSPKDLRSHATSYTTVWLLDELQTGNLQKIKKAQRPAQKSHQINAMQNKKTTEVTQTVTEANRSSPNWETWYITLKKTKLNYEMKFSFQQLLRFERTQQHTTGKHLPTACLPTLQQPWGDKQSETKAKDIIIITRQWHTTADSRVTKRSTKTEDTHI